MNSLSTEPKHASYMVEKDDAMRAQFAKIDALTQQIDAIKNDDADLWQTILKRLRTDWTYHSNTLEGSTLSRGETHFFLTEGLTVEGKPFKDFVDAQNHAEAIDLLFDIVADRQPITEGVIKDLNALLLRGVHYTPAKNALGQRVAKRATPGQYKEHPNHVEQSDGTIHYYVEPAYVRDQMETLVGWINETKDSLHAVERAAVAHYHMVRIHPFDDGNGRGARILMNLILLKQGYFPAVIQKETKRRYLDALVKADQGERQPFVRFVADALIATKTSVIEALTKRASNSAKQF